MKGRVKVKRVASCSLVAVLALAIFCAGPEALDTGGSGPVAGGDGAGTNVSASTGTAISAVPTADVEGKDEVVYARLGAGGGAESVYVVNHFDVASAGGIVDYGDYIEVKNLTDTGPLTRLGNAVSFEAKDDDFYYQGEMVNTGLPWIFDMSWSLDGKETAPEDLAGASGKLELKVTSKENPAVDSVWYDNYMLQIVVTLDTAKCSNIDAPESMTAEAGGSKAVTYTVMPGDDANYFLRADVHDFAMTGIQITGVPYSMDVELPDMDGQFDDLNRLPAAISELNDGVGELLKGSNELKSGAKKLADGSSGIKGGLDALKGNSGKLRSASAKIKKALGGIADSIPEDSAGDIDMSQLKQLSDALDQLATGLKGMSGGLGELKNGFTRSLNALDTAINDIPQGTLTQERIEVFMGSVPAEQQAAAAELVENYRAAQTVKGTYGAVKPGFDAVTDTIDTMKPALDTMAANIAGMSTGIKTFTEDMEQLFSGLKDLNKNYAGFHSGLVSYTSGVDKLAKNYRTFNSGLSGFSSGIGSFSGGVARLRNGTNTLDASVAGLPDLLQEEIDKMKEEYLPSDFAPASFTSPENDDTAYVQFVIQCKGIERPQTSGEPQETNAPETLWERLEALFNF